MTILGRNMQTGLIVASGPTAPSVAPELAEAHNALGNHYVRLGFYEDALRHFDQVVFSERKQGRTSAVIGWRANVLFNLGDGQAAFREINGLMSQADRHDWSWRGVPGWSLPSGERVWKTPGQPPASGSASSMPIPDIPPRRANS